MIRKIKFSRYSKNDILLYSLKKSKIKIFENKNKPIAFTLSVTLSFT